MESISIFDILKIGMGPSSSHTMGPWKAMQMALEDIQAKFPNCAIQALKVTLFGSLAKTGIGHGTDKAIILGLLGHDPKTIDCDRVEEYIQEVISSRAIRLDEQNTIPFDPKTDIILDYQQTFAFHSNALKVSAQLTNGERFESVYFSIGGGFVVKGKSEADEEPASKLPYPIDQSSDLLKWCRDSGFPISEIVIRNELFWNDRNTIYERLQMLVDTMKACVYKGCHTSGNLPGGLNVKRRASYQNELMISSKKYDNVNQWIRLIRKSKPSFKETLNWVSCFALAVNEENASFGRVVTAPTNGAAGVIPAVMLYYLCFCDDTKEEDLHDYLLVAGEIGSIFKKGATISAAMGGCMAEIGVSSAMAAAGLTHVSGGSPEEVLMAAEIAMEHHLGLTCDPIAGLVQVPCIERNAMGAMKAITASQIALASDPHYAKVSLDDVIKTMWQTATDMNSKYKETSEAGLATQIPVSLADC